jgi:hypothetical protein
MSIIKSLNQTSEKAIDVGEQYYRKTQEYYKLKVFQQLTLTISVFCKSAIIGGLFFLAIIFFAVSGTIVLTESLGSAALACLIIASSLIILSIIAYILRSKIDSIVIRKMGKNFFD